MIEHAPGVVFQGDGWTSKNLRIKGQMKRKNDRLLRKERDFKNDGGVPKLSPNVGGELVDSWSEAQRMARSRGKDESTYEPMVRQEKIEKVKGRA